MLTQTPREVRFLIAAKSLKRVVVGFFARLLRSIPVSRPQDLASKVPTVLLLFSFSIVFSILINLHREREQ